MFCLSSVFFGVQLGTEIRPTRVKLPKSTDLVYHGGIDVGKNEVNVWEIPNIKGTLFCTSTPIEKKLVLSSGQVVRRVGDTLITPTEPKVLVSLDK